MPTQITLSQDDIDVLNSAAGYSAPFDWTQFTQDQIAYLKALVAWIKTHPG